MLTYKNLVRPIMFSLSPELAHSLGELLMSFEFPWKLVGPHYKPKDSRLRTTLAGIELTNPLGVAAGCDKNCKFLASLLHLGFGYVVGGTVTLNPRTGNPKPRIIRNPSKQSLTNSLGFPSMGSVRVSKNIKNSSANPLILSVSGMTIEEFVSCFRKMEPLADGTELNISSPNSAGLKVFHETKTFRALLEEINGVRTKPVFVKIPPYFDSRGQQEVLQLVKLSKQLGIDGITATNTKPVEDPCLKMGRGGLSGSPLYNDMLDIVSDVRDEAGKGMFINACGGISKPEDAIEAIQKGANTVQIYTGLIYEGPGIAKAINRGLSKYLDLHKLDSVDSI